MARRGRCRCGTVLHFERTAAGYKTRCPTCKAVVRLRIGTPPPPPPIRRKRDTDYVAAPLPDDPDATAPVDLSVLSEHESSAPAAVVELEAYHDPEPSPVRSPLLLVLLALIGVVCVGLAVAFVFYA